jgi:hypothetical protein
LGAVIRVRNIDHRFLSGCGPIIANGRAKTVNPHIRCIIAGGEAAAAESEITHILLKEYWSA